MPICFSSVNATSLHTTRPSEAWARCFIQAILCITAQCLQWPKSVMQRDFLMLTPIFSFSFHFLLLLTHGLWLLLWWWRWHFAVFSVKILNLFESKAENPQAGFLYTVAVMCAPGIPVSSEGWEEVRSIDPEEETIQARRAGAGKQQWVWGTRIPLHYFFQLVTSLYLTLPLYLFFQCIYSHSVCVRCGVILSHFLNSTKFPATNFICSLFLWEILDLPYTPKDCKTINHICDLFSCVVAKSKKDLKIRMFVFPEKKEKQ